MRALRGAIVAGLMLALTLLIPSAFADSTREQPASAEPGPAEAAMAVLDRFMRAFNARDLAAWEATYHFPHFRMASGELTVLPKAGSRPDDFFQRFAESTGWHHSAWLERELVQVGANKVHIAVKFARYREDGSVLATYDSFYVVTRQDGEWGIKGRSSFAP